MHRGDAAVEVCDRGYDHKRNTFTWYYGSRELDASLLLMNEIGFLPADDERLKGAVAATEKQLCRDGFVQRYTMNERTEKPDGLPPGGGAFLPCTFWPASSYILAGRREEGRAVFERLLGLLSEEYDVGARRLVGNFPQALRHLALVNTAMDLVSERGPSHRRAGTGLAR